MKVEQTDVEQSHSGDGVLPGRSHDADVLIVGGGAVGLALACTLADALGADASIAVLDRADLARTPQPENDARAYALSVSSRNLVASVGAWQDLAPHAQAMTAIEITDSSLDDAFRPRLLGYDNHVQDGEPGTWVVNDSRLRACLLDAARRRRGVQLVGGAAVADVRFGPTAAEVELADGQRWRAPLVVAADGRQSLVRDRAGIKIVQWAYDQIGIVTTVKLAKPHAGRAIQHFLPAGPFAILPLPDDHACITWSETARRGAEIMRLPDADFHSELELRFGHRLGGFTLAGPRASWPLKMHLARALVGERVALAGDAAHGVHPIAGQGLNLGLRDVAALTEVIVDAARLGLDYGQSSVLVRYERWRRLDSTMSAASYDLLNRLFSSDVSVVRAVRGAGLGLVDKVPALKQFFVQEAAGLTGDVPKLLRGVTP